jgi:Na+-translocating ferredoxin:NAD+ oxidoreductase RnfC subunit
MTEDDKALVTRLRAWMIDIYAKVPGAYVDIREAADRIEAQAAEIERLRKALVEIEDYIDTDDRAFYHHAVQVARAALDAKP